MSDPVRLAIAGCGRIVERGYAPAAASLDGIRVVGLADPDAGRLARCLKSLPAAEAFPDAATLLDRSRLDAIVIATPARLHEPIASLAAPAGIPALVEKPPAPDLEGSLRLAAMRPSPRIGFNRRFLQGAELAEAVPADGWVELDLELRYRRDGWGAHEARDEALLDAGVHMIDLACFLAGSAPISVRGAAVSPERATLELELGRGRARIRCATDRRHLERVTVRDRAGRALGESRLGGVRGRWAALRGQPHPLVLSLRRQLAGFAAAVQDDPDAVGDGGPLAGADAGVAVMSVVEAARRSAELGGAEVTVGEIPAGRAVS